MQIPVSYSSKSIVNAIKQVEEYRKKVQSIIPTFFQQCADKIISLANEKLKTVDVDDGLIAEIKNAWQPLRKTDNNTYVLENTNDKSIYIEFGVGQVGKESPHDMASKENYNYDINNHGEKGWAFISTKGQIDIPTKNRLYEFDTKRGLLIRTAGQPASMFAFNAVQDFIDGEMYVDIAKQLFKGL